MKKIHLSLLIVCLFFADQTAMGKSKTIAEASSSWLQSADDQLSKSNENWLQRSTQETEERSSGRTDGQTPTTDPVVGTITFGDAWFVVLLLAGGYLLSCRYRRKKVMAIQ
jgi:hypothetical protein